MLDESISANCALGLGVRKYRRKEAEAPMSRLSRDAKRLHDYGDTVFDSFHYFPHSSREHHETIEEFLEDYRDFLSIPSDAELIEIPKSASECETCPERRGCLESKFHPYKMLFTGKLNTSQLPFVPSNQTRAGRTITLKDVRMNGYRVELKLKRPRYVNDAGREYPISLAPVRFLSFGITTRLAIAVADLYQRYAENLIAQGFGISKTTLYRILGAWHNLNYSDLSTDHIYWTATGALGDTIVEFVVDATEMTLCGIRYLKKSSARYWRTPDSTAFAVFGMMPNIEPFETKPFSYNDVYTLLEEIFQSSWRLSPPKVGFAEVEELHETFTKELAKLHFLCLEITTQLESPVPNNSAITVLRKYFNQKLRVLALMANSQNQNGSCMLPVFGNVAELFLKQRLRITTDPADYNPSDPSRFSGTNRQNLTLLLEFLETVKQASQGNRNLRGMCHRLTLFNEPASAKVIKFGQAEQPRIASAYSLLKPEDFYQPQIQITPPPISCLIHLIKHGLLDTESPVIDLPCVKHRLSSNGQGSCKIPVCPVLDGKKLQ